jgi:hypothetical protein
MCFNYLHPDEDRELDLKNLIQRSMPLSTFFKAAGMSDQPDPST